MFRGSKVLGDEIPLGVQCANPAGVPTAPDAAPVMKVYTNAGVLVRSMSIPPDKGGATGLFSYMLPLNSLFSTGRHFVRYSYLILGVTYVPDDIDVFVINPGGSADGEFLSLHYMDRPDQQDWVLGQTSQGVLTAARGPQI